MLDIFRLGPVHGSTLRIQRTMKIEAALTLGKKKKGTCRYENSGLGAAVSTLYVRNSAIEGKPPMTHASGSRRSRRETRPSKGF